MGFRVGDKVKVVDMLRPSESFEVGETGKVVGIYEYCNNFPISVRMDKDKEVIDFSKEELELYKEDKMEKTFQEVIRDIKEGEVWESDSIAWDIKSIEKNGDFIKIEKRNNSTTLSIRPDCKFLLRRKEYTFEEAFAAYEEGKVIESCKYIYKKRNDETLYKNIESGDQGRLKEIQMFFTLEEIRGAWYIRE